MKKKIRNSWYFPKSTSHFRISLWADLLFRKLVDIGCRAQQSTPWLSFKTIYRKLGEKIKFFLINGTINWLKACLDRILNVVNAPSRISCLLSCMILFAKTALRKVNITRIMRILVGWHSVTWLNFTGSLKKYGLTVSQSSIGREIPVTWQSIP